MKTPRTVSELLKGRGAALTALFALQAFCVAMLAGDALGDFFGLAADAAGDDDGDGLEAVVVVALIFGLIYSGAEMLRVLRRQRLLEDQLRAASGAFNQLLQERFETWELTAAERDVALLALKGLSIAEIAGLRDSKEGTVKAQCSAIYRKAGVSGRPQLISLFIEELMADEIAPAAGASDLAREAACDPAE